jgi:hypothetical protein
MTEVATKGLNAKLAEAIQQVDSVAKDKTNDFHHYAYASAEAVYEAVRGPLLDRGVFLLPSVTGGTQDGNTTTVQLHLTLID